jgi:hypothetical protein
VAGTDDGDALSQHLGDLLVADRAHVYSGASEDRCTCIMLVYI